MKYIILIMLSCLIMCGGCSNKQKKDIPNTAPVPTLSSSLESSPTNTTTTIENHNNVDAGILDNLDLGPLWDISISNDWELTHMGTDFVAYKKYNPHQVISIEYHNSDVPAELYINTVAKQFFNDVNVPILYIKQIKEERFNLFELKALDNATGNIMFLWTANKTNDDMLFILSCAGSSESDIEEVCNKLIKSFNIN